MQTQLPVLQSNTGCDGYYVQQKHRFNIFWTVFIGDKDRIYHRQRPLIRHAKTAFTPSKHGVLTCNTPCFASQKTVFSVKKRVAEHDKILFREF